MICLLIFSHTTAHLFGHPPPYHYSGMFPLKDDNFIMFQPYREFILNNDHQHKLCRAYDEPKCTFWNARLLSVLNLTMNETVITYRGAPWIADMMEHAQTNYSSCIQWCDQQNCTAWQFWFERDVCVISLSEVRIDMDDATTQMFIEQKMPTRVFAVKKKREVRDEHVRAWMDQFVEKAECRLNKFRCYA